MKEYTTYCTTEQTQRALELGATLESGIAHGGHWSGEERPFIYRAPEPNCIAWNNSSCWFCPTTQQMFGWLREQNIFIVLRHQRYCSNALIKHFNNDTQLYEDIDIVYITEEFSEDMYKEWEISAIDIALDYLEKHKTD